MNNVLIITICFTIIAVCLAIGCICQALVEILGDNSEEIIGCHPMDMKESKGKMCLNGKTVYKTTVQEIMKDKEDEDG